MSREGGGETQASVLACLDAGTEVPEGVLVRCLRSPGCPRELVERLTGCHWIRSRRRVVPLLVRHPGCPQGFAMDALPRLGWHDLLLVVRDPRTRPAIRRQGERKLVDRLKQLTIGERTALARHATRGVIAALLADEAPAIVQALLDNAQFTEQDAVRLLHATGSGECVAAVLRHPRLGWGACRGGRGSPIARCTARAGARTDRHAAAGPTRGAVPFSGGFDGGPGAAGGAARPAARRGVCDRTRERHLTRA